MTKEPLLGHLHPPAPKDDSLYNQTAPTEVTMEELMEYRKVPKFSTKIVVIQALMSIVFGIPKVVLGLAFGLIAGPFFVVAVSIWRAFGKPEAWREPLKKLWSTFARIFLFFLGFVKVNYHGHPDSDARFIVANHTCFFDGWFFLPFGPRPLGKKELLDIPCIREMADVYRGIPVDRSKSCGLTKELIANAQDTNMPQIMILPEGASTSGDYMLRFHLGAFLTDLPVQPVTLRYTLWGTSRKISNISFFHNYHNHILAFLSIPFITLDVTFLEPMNIKADGENDPRKFADAVSLRIANTLGVRLLSLGSSAIYKKKETPKADK